MLGSRKKRVAISLDLDDYLWAKSHRFEFSRRFSEYLKALRRQVDAATYQLSQPRQAEAA